MTPEIESDLLIWKPARVDGGCRLTEFDGFDEDHRLRLCQALAAVWPGNVRYGMDPEAPNDMVLSDSLRARLPVIVATRRLADFLCSAASNRVELLPVQIVNHKRRVVPESYFIVNPLVQQDILDLPRCKPQWSKIEPDWISAMKRLVIDTGRADPAVPIFRVNHYLRPIVVRRALAQAIDAAGFTGITWQDPADYDTA